MSEPALTVLIVEDGNEYLDNLSRFVPGPKYLQAHNAIETLNLLQHETVDLVYMDMRFDRIPEQDLVGDFEQAVRQMNGDTAKAWRNLQNNQGLYIMDRLKHAGHGDIPIILAYDFSREERRFQFLTKSYPNLGWVPDAVTPDEIRNLMAALVLKGSSAV